METQISKLLVHDCCIVRVQCQSVFPGFQVNLDLFHVVQRVTKCILKEKNFLSSSGRNYNYKKMREILRPISIIF